MPGSKHNREHEVVDVMKEFVKTEVERQVFRNEYALLCVLERLDQPDGRLLEELQRVYREAYPDGFRHPHNLLETDLTAYRRIVEMLNVLSGRAAIRPTHEEETCQAW